MSASYDIECAKGEHATAMAVAFVCVGIWVIGIPAAVLLTLRLNRAHLHNKSSPKHEDVVAEFGTLYLQVSRLRLLYLLNHSALCVCVKDSLLPPPRALFDLFALFALVCTQYEPRYYYWEVTVILKKMMLTGAMTIIAAGSSAQLVIALIIVLFNMILVLKAGPYVDATDDYLASLTSLQMLMTLLFGIMIKTDNPNDPTYDPATLESLLIAINSLGFVALVISLAMLHPRCRKRANGDTAKAETRVVPVSPPAVTKSTTTTKKGGERAEQGSDGSSGEFASWS